MSDTECGSCGATRKIGHVICQYCKKPYSSEAARTAIACPKCRVLSTSEQQQCVACGTWIVVQCVFCGARSPYTMSACGGCGEIFLGSSERKAQMDAAGEDDDDDDDYEDGWEYGWAWCDKCQAVVYDAEPAGPCAAGGRHDTSDSDDYALNVDDEDYGPTEDGWLWCKHCQCLFHGASSHGVCVGARGGPHDGSDSYDYAMGRDVPGRDEGGWKWCRKCSVMFWGDEAGACAAGGAHDQSGRAHYSVVEE